MVEQIIISDITIDLIYKDIKNIHLSVHPPTGRVTIAAPERTNSEALRAFAASKIGWIRKQQRKQLDQKRETPREFVERESHYLWGDRYLLSIVEDAGRQEVSVRPGKIVAKVRHGSDAAMVSRLMEAWYRGQLRAYAEAILPKWEQRLDVLARRLFVQKMKTKWGSATPAKQYIRLNLELAKQPKECVDYVIAHELAHFHVPNHGEAFANILDTHLPNWRHIRKRLNDGILGHVDW